MNLVSIIMPAFNAGKYIRASIDSVVNQTHSHWQLIIVDDGSTDNTASIAKEYAARDNRIAYIYQENGKQGKARNNGLQNSTGEYVAFLDADDLWLPEKLAKQLVVLDDTGADLVFSGFYIFSETPSFKGGENSCTGFVTKENDLRKFLISNYIPMLTVVLKRTAIDKVHGFSEKEGIQNSEDYHLWLKLLAEGFIFTGMNEQLAHYRLHSASATSADRQVIFPMLSALQELTLEYPAEERLINECFLVRLNMHFRQNNISSWPIIERLINLRDYITGEKSNLFFWKIFHIIFGKRIFRYLYTFRLKMNPGKPRAGLQLGGIKI